MLHNRTVQIIVIVFFAFAIRVAYSYSLRNSDLIDNSDAKHYVDASHELASTGSLYNDAHIRAYQPPLYFAFLAGVEKILPDSIFAMRVMQSVLGGLLCLVLYFIGTEFRSHATGLVAAILCAVSPTMIHYSATICSESLFILLVFSGLYLIVRRLFNNTSLVSAIAAGILFGLAALTREVAFVFLAGLSVVCLMQRPLATSFQFVLITWICAIAVIVPWTIRNFKIFDTVVPIATNAGINLYMGNHPGSTGEFNWALPDGVNWNAPAPEGKPEGYYEYQANQMARDSAVAFIKADWMRFGSLCLHRVWILLSPPSVDRSDKGMVAYAIAVVRFGEWVILFFCSLFLFPIVAAKNRLRGPGLLIVSCVCLLAPYVIAVAQSRYRVPIFPILILATSIVTETFVVSRLFKPKKPA